MCGIVGIVTRNKYGFTDNERSALIDGLYIDALRGTDGTGLMYGRGNGEIVVVKEASPSWEFLTKPEAKTASNEIFGNGRWAFGHNRAATRGVKKDANSHPFVVDDNIVLLQNGTYVGDHKHHKNVEVDTEAIAHVIHEHPDDLENALQKINAAYVLVWWNNTEKSLNIIRNDERPLYWAECTKGSLFFFSEWGIAYAACARHDIEFKGVPKLVATGLHLKFDFSKMSDDWKLTKKSLDITFKKEHAAPFPLTHWKQSGGSMGDTSHLLTNIDGGKKLTEVNNAGPRLSCDLRGYTLEDAYAVIKTHDPTFNSVTSNFSRVFAGKQYTQSQRASIQTIIKDAGQVVVQWQDYQAASHHYKNEFFYLYGTVMGEDGTALNGLPVYLVVRGELDDVRNYVKHYESLVNLDGHSILTRGQVNMDAAYVAVPINFNKVVIDWSTENATQTH